MEILVVVLYSIPAIAWLVAHIWSIKIGFGIHWGWGLANLSFVGNIVFFIRHWSTAPAVKKCGLIWFSSYILLWLWVLAFVDL